MAFRMLLSFALDFFRCRRSILGQPVGTKPSAAVDPMSKMSQTQPDICLPTKPQFKTELELQLDREKELQIEVEQAVEDPQLDRRTELDLQQHLEREKTDSIESVAESDSDSNSYRDIDNDIDNYKDIENDSDSYDYGYDDPRLPEMII
ncbi:hypothetical protein KR222_009494 [Zaprionus bogoriensis]|nr:hypothetical protein KR222_009494 [Zaprionus bogoriensis]